MISKKKYKTKYLSCNECGAISFLLSGWFLQYPLQEQLLNGNSITNANDLFVYSLINWKILNVSDSVLYYQ